MLKAKDMKYLDLTLPTPEENLACDEALLELCEEGGGDQILRFWESPTYFVALGYANKAESEVNLAACAAEQIPIFRRCSGGGTVLQGPGCLNYCLILKIDEVGPLQSISSTNAFVMKRHQEALGTLLSRDYSMPNKARPHPGPLPQEREPLMPVPGKVSSHSAFSSAGKGTPSPWGEGRGEGELLVPEHLRLSKSIEVTGHTDLALENLKFSGNAQRRHKNCLLFHGTFLVDFPILRIEEFLHFPSRQPPYRQNRSHKSFLCNVNADRARIKESLMKTWQAIEPLEKVPIEKISNLVAEKYTRREWNLKF